MWNRCGARKGVAGDGLLSPGWAESGARGGSRADGQDWGSGRAVGSFGGGRWVSAVGSKMSVEKVSRLSDPGAAVR